MKDSDVQIDGRLFDTSLRCSECNHAHTSRVFADHDEEARSKALSIFVDDKWTDGPNGPLCWKCSEKK